MKEFLDKFYLENSKESLKQFSKKLVFTKYEIVGVNIPLLRRTAKELLNKFSLNKILDYEDNIFETKMMTGFALLSSKLSEIEKFQHLDAYLKSVDNWSICDSVASSNNLKSTYAYKKYLSYLNSKDVYTVRYGIVMLKKHFLTDEYIDQVINKLININSEEYYINMAIAWTLQEASTKFTKKIMALLESGTLNNIIYKMTTRKIRESKRR